jgi:hypothetical protein
VDDHRVIATVHPLWTDQVTALAAAVAAVGTVLTFIALVIQLSLEWSRRRDDEKRYQAQRVSAWLGERDPPSVRAHSLERRQQVVLQNSTGEPAYMAVLYVVHIQGTAPHTGEENEEHFRSQRQTSGELHTTAETLRTCVSIIPPGRSYTTISGEWTAMAARTAIEIAFTDRAGVHWVRRSNGSLVKLSVAPVDHYSITGPYDWQIPSLEPPELRSNRQLLADNPQTGKRRTDYKTAAAYAKRLMSRKFLNTPGRI